MLGHSADPTQSLRSGRPQWRPSCRLRERSGFLPPRKVTAPKSSLSCAATHSFKGPRGRQRLPGPRGERQVSPPHRLQRSLGRVCRQGHGELRVEVGVGARMDGARGPSPPGSCRAAPRVVRWWSRGGSGHSARAPADWVAQALNTWFWESTLFWFALESSLIHLAELKPTETSF